MTERPFQISHVVNVLDQMADGGYGTRDAVNNFLRQKSSSAVSIGDMGNYNIRRYTLNEVIALAALVPLTSVLGTRNRQDFTPKLVKFLDRFDSNLPTFTHLYVVKALYVRSKPMICTSALLEEDLPEHAVVVDLQRVIKAALRLKADPESVA